MPVGWEGAARGAAGRRARLRLLRAGEPLVLRHGDPCLPRSLSSCLSLAACQQGPFRSGPLPSHPVHPGTPEGSGRPIPHPACGAAAVSACHGGGRCLDLTLLPSGFAAERRLKNRKQTKAVRKSGICVVSPKAERRNRQLGSSACCGALGRGRFSWRGLGFITYFLFCRFAALDIFTTWFLG